MHARTKASCSSARVRWSAIFELARLMHWTSSKYSSCCEGFEANEALEAAELLPTNFAAPKNFLLIEVVAALRAKRTFFPTNIA
jgi:hypothetical protein